MSAENDSVLEMIDRWKRRAHGAFLLIASVLGAAALLLLEAGIVVRAWELNFSSPHADGAASDITKPTPRYGIATAAENSRQYNCSCPPTTGDVRAADREGPRPDAVGGYQPGASPGRANSLSTATPSR